ncbi:MAG: hypothetical protein ACRDFR_00190 [Candidatus Limnocylindria bacterium]
MRRQPVLLLVLAALLLGCSVPPYGGDPNPESPVGHTPGRNEPLPSGNGSVRETPDPAVVDAHPTGISHFTIGPDGRTVVVYYWGGNQACFGLQKVAVGVADDGTPTITVFEGTHPEAVGQACTMEALLKSAVVTLDEPVVVDDAQPAAPAGEAELAPEPEIVEVDSSVLDPIPVAITGYHLSGDGLTLIAHFYGGVPECYGLADASISTTIRPWIVRVGEGRVPGAEVCIEIALAKAVELILDAPLIRDGSLSVN